MKKLKVVMFQLPFPEFGVQKNWGNTPWGAASLKATALSKGLDDYFDIDILPAEINDQAGDAFLIEHLKRLKPDVLCATLYLWNSKRSLYIAEQLKQHLPELLFVVGGPEVCDDSPYILNHLAVDYGCIGEGEFIFCHILEVIAGLRDIPDMEGVFYSSKGGVIRIPGQAVVEQLEELPSFLTTDDAIDLRNASIVSYETMRGCPCQCSYCMTSTIPWRTYTAERIIKDLVRCKELGVKKIRMICSNFLLHPDFFTICAELAKINVDRRMELVCFAYAEQVTEKHAQALAACNFISVETGLQTIHPATLKKICRPPFNQKRFLSGLQHLEQFGIDYRVDAIVGLPDETALDIDATIGFLNQNNIAKYDLFRLHLLPNTPLRRQADHYEMNYNPDPPYYLRHSHTLSNQEINKYIQSFNDLCGREEDCYDYITGFLPNLQETATRREGINPESTFDSVSIIHQVRISTLIDCQQVMGMVGPKLAANVVLYFTDLESGLPSYAQLTAAIWALSPNTCIKAIFRLKTADEIDFLSEALKVTKDMPLVKTTIIIDEGDVQLTGLLPHGCTIMKRFFIDSPTRAEEVLNRLSSHSLFAFSPKLSTAERRRAVQIIADEKGENEFQYEILSDYLLVKQIGQAKEQNPSSLFYQLNTGTVVRIDGQWSCNSVLQIDNQTKLALLKFQHVQH